MKVTTCNSRREQSRSTQPRLPCESQVARASNRQRKYAAKQRRWPAVCCCAEPTEREVESPKQQQQQQGEAQFSEYETWPATSPPPRRLIVGLITATGIAIGGNLGGITSNLAGLDGGRAAGALKLDAILPVNGLKRCMGQDFEFLYPSNWLADVTIYRRRIEAAEFQRGLSFESFADQERVAKRRKVEPVAAFGPQGGRGEENISVIRAVSQGLRLQNLGSPETVGNWILENQIAKPGGDKVAELVAASRTDVGSVTYYELEYKVRKDGGETWARHNKAVLAAVDDVLYTFNAQCNERDWAQYRATFEKAAQSFRITV